MARRKKDGSKRAAKVSKRKAKQQNKSAGTAVVEKASADTPDLAAFGRRLAEQSLRDLTPGSRRRPTPEQVEAEEFYGQALQAQTASERLDLATRAIELDPDHIDARTLVVEVCPDAEIALGLAGETVELAANLLGETVFENEVGHFWNLLDTRPYMRARLALVQRLVAATQLEAAVEHMRDMLRLNPGDNQGVRWVLLHTLLRLDDWDAANALLDEYPDEGFVTFQFTRALTTFRNEGDSPRVRDLLEEAIEGNSHVIPLLAGTKQTSLDTIGLVVAGGESEAQVYSQQFLPFWVSTPGAVNWLRTAAPAATAVESADDGVKLEVDVVTDPERQIRQLRSQIAELPVTDDPWLCVVDEDVAEPHLAMIVLRTTAPPQMCLLDTGDFARPAVVLAELLSQMCGPHEGEPCRPPEVQFTDPDLHRSLKRRFPSLDIRSDVCDDPDVLTLIQPLKQFFCDTPGAIADDSTPLENLPLAPMLVWEVDWRELNVEVVSDDGEPVRPWALLAVDPISSVVLASEVQIEEPDADNLADFLSRSMRQPAVGNSVRPGAIRVQTHDGRLMIHGFLDELDIDCNVDTFEGLDEVFDDMQSHLSKNADPM